MGCLFVTMHEQEPSQRTTGCQPGNRRERTLRPRMLESRIVWRKSPEEGYRLEIFLMKRGPPSMW